MRGPRRPGRGVGRPGAARGGRAGRVSRAGRAGRPRPVALPAAVWAVLMVLTVLATGGGCTAGNGGPCDGAFTGDGDPNAIVIASGRDITGRGGVRQ